MEAAAEIGSTSPADLLRNARFEVLPLEGIEEQVQAHLGPDVKVTVTASPRRGLDATLELTERLTEAGYATVPHLSARLVRDRSHLSELLDRLLAGGRARAVRARGDADEPAGEFPGAVELLEAMGPRRAEFEAIGITGYPESHHLISDEETIRAMFAKAPMATHIVSQLCFDAATIAGWIAEVRRRGTDLPIWIGVPGNVAVREAAARLDEDRAGRVGALPAPPPQLAVAPGHPPVQARPPGARADPVRDRPGRPRGGFHLYTFNEVARTERWRRAALERLGRRLSAAVRPATRPAASRRPPRASPPRSPSPRRRASPCRTGRRPRACSAPVSAASRARSSLISPARSSIHMCAPPAPQQNVRLPLRSISIG